MLAKMKGLFSRVRVFLGIVAVFALLPAAGGSIVWDAPKPITSLEDVSTNGAMVYAHFCYFSYWTSLYPRGQRFLPWHKNTHAGIVKFAEDAELRPGQYGRNTVSTNLIDLLTGTDQERDQYRRLLYCSVESARSKKGEPLTLRLKQLQPGMRYEVQLWSNANTDTNWCDQPMLVDGGPTQLATYTPWPGGTNGPGQYITGTFIATNTFYDLTLMPVSNRIAVLNMFQLRLLSPNPVRWEQPLDITGEDDIRTDGQSVFAWAFTGTNYMLKGTTFRSYDTSSRVYPRAEFSLYDSDARHFYDFIISPTNVYSMGMHKKFYEENQLAKSDYFRMLAGGIYRDNWSTPLLLGTLRRGHTYLIQLWVGDGRAEAPTSGWSYRTVSVDASAPLQYGGGPDKLGQYIVGTFVAHEDVRRVMLTTGILADAPVKPSRCFQINAIQVRDLTPDLVDWEPVREVTGDPAKDVDSKGTSFYAWHGGTNDVIYGGVTFRARHTAGRDCGQMNPEAEREIYYSHPCCEVSTGMVARICAQAIWPAETSETLRELLDCACCLGHGTPRLIHLRRLLPGQRYRVQFFFNDSRTNGWSKQHFLLDGQARMSVVMSNVAYCATGEFTATGPERAIELTAAGYAIMPFVQAIQVRALNPAGMKEALVRADVLVSRAETDVRKEGTLLEALCGENVSPNGEPFKKPNDLAWSGTANIFLPSGFKFYSDVAKTWCGGTSDFARMLAGGFYEDDVGKLTLTLGNLTPGKRYRVQVWQCDSRKEYPNRYSEVDRFGGMYYNGPYNLGYYALIDFTAAAETWPLTIKSPWVQVNAIQLRDLGVFDAYETWSGAKALAGDTVLTGDVLAEDGLEVTGPGKLSGTGSFLRGNCTLNAVWDGETISRVDTGRTTLAVAPSRAQTFVVTGEGSIQLAEGVTAAATYVRGDGTFAGPGRLDYALTGDAAFDGCLAENLVVRKTGRGTWRLSGAQAGTARVEAPEGGLALASGIFTGDWTLAASNTVVVSGVNFGSGSALRLAEATSLAVKGPATLDNMTLHVANPYNYLQRKAHPIVVYGPEATGEPQVVLEKSGFVLASETRADGSIALYALVRRGLTVSIR